MSTGLLWICLLKLITSPQVHLWSSPLMLASIMSSNPMWNNLVLISLWVAWFKSSQKRLSPPKWHTYSSSNAAWCVCSLDPWCMALFSRESDLVLQAWTDWQVGYLNCSWVSCVPWPWVTWSIYWPMIRYFRSRFSVATVMTNVFRKNGIMVSRKLARILRIFVDMAKKHQSWLWQH